MNNNKRVVKKLIFITVSALTMVALSKLFSKHTPIDGYSTAQILIGGASCGLLSSFIFDWYNLKKKKDDINNQLKEALSDLQEIKAIIKR